MSEQERIQRNRAAGVVDGEMVLDTGNFHKANGKINASLFEMGKNPGLNAFVEITEFEGSVFLRFDGDDGGEFSLWLGFSEGELECRLMTDARKPGSPVPIQLVVDE